MRNTKAEKNVKRLNQLRANIKSNIHLYDRKTYSPRFYGWVDSYNDLRNCDGWKEYCAIYGSVLDHNAWDLIA